jgi:DNA repair protein RadC
VTQSPLQKLRSVGAETLSAIELVAVALAREDDSSEEAIADARKLILRIGGLRDVGSMAPIALAEAGLQPLEAAKFLCLVELGRRTTEAGQGSLDTVADAADVYRLFKHLRLERQEHFCAVLLDVKNNVLKRSVVHKGTLSASIVGVREFFREAIREGAASVIAVHNHPSGDPTPSREDFEVTKVLVEAGKLLDIPLLDHVIVGEREFRSLQQLGAIG